MDRLRVWVDEKPVGWFSRHGRGTTFVYDAHVAPGDAVSLNMPVRAASYDMEFRMLPAFDTNMPEGELRQKINRVLAKDDRGRSDPFDVLALTGGNQIGRVRLLPEDETPQRRTPVGSIDAILAAKSNSEMIRGIIEHHALRSGVSGAMPKILADTEEDTGRQTVQTRDWIMKFDAKDIPGLSLNEYHCMEAARRAGNITAEAHLSDDGKTLAVLRFDERDGKRLGFEDFASLNAKTSDDKYDGSLETSIFKRLAENSKAQSRDNLERAYRQVLTSVGLRNGDAHLKNFALLYDDSIEGPFELAPVYDIVTTRAFDEYKDDNMSLTLGGTKRWPKAAQMKQLGARARLQPKRASEIMQEVADGIRAQMTEMVLDISARGNPDLAMRMAQEWNEGISFSLGADPVDIASITPDEEALAAHREVLEARAAARMKIEDPFTADATRSEPDEDCPEP